MLKNSKIFISGHKGLIGSALLKELKKKNYNNLLIKTRKQLELDNKEKVDNFFKTNKPEVVIICSGKSGNLHKCINSPSTLFFENIFSQNNIINSSKKYKVKKLIYIGSSCVYPNITNRSLKEEDLLTGSFDKDTLTYTLVKLSGILLCKSINEEYFNGKNKFISVIPNTAYGPNDNFSYENSHVFSALIKKFHLAKSKNLKNVEVLGSGKPKREFIYSGDIANAIVFLMEQSHLAYSFYNIGTGVETSIKELSKLVSNKIKFNGKINFNTKKPDGRKSKLLNSSKLLSLGWRPSINIEEGLELTYEWYKKNNNE